MFHKLTWPEAETCIIGESYIEPRQGIEMLLLSRGHAELLNNLLQNVRCRHLYHAVCCILQVTPWLVCFCAFHHFTMTK
jgi:hypothetical protein